MRYMLIEWHFAGEIWFVNDQFWGYPISGQTPLVQIRKLLCPYFVKIYRVVGSDSRASKIVPIPKTPWTPAFPANFHQPWRLYLVRGWYDCRLTSISWYTWMRSVHLGLMLDECPHSVQRENAAMNLAGGGGPSMFFRMPPLWPCCSASLGRDS